MRELWARHGPDDRRVVAEYATAERLGVAPRASNRHGVGPDLYAKALLADGLKKGWLGESGGLPLANASSGVGRGIEKFREPKTDASLVAPLNPVALSNSGGAATGATVPLDLGGLSTPNLLLLSAGVIEELRRRQVVRSTNNPVADYAEFLAARAFGLNLAGRSEAGYDGKDAEGLRYQVKARRLTSANPSRQLGFIRSLDADPFDLLLAVLFNSDYTVFRAALLPVAAVRARATWVEYVRAWRLVLTEATFVVDGVRDITEEIRSAAAVDLLISVQAYARD
jgi:hypothetical protein